MANNISTDVQEVAFAYLSEPRENLSGALEWNIGLNVPVSLTCSSSMDAALEEIADKQKAGKFPKPTPQGWNTPLERQLQERGRRQQDQG